MTADKNIGNYIRQQFLYPRIIPWRNATDVSHPDFHSFAGKNKVFRETALNISVVDVPIYCPERFERFQTLNQFQITQISCMPDLIDSGKVCEYFGI
jgi:hypothetical protein